MLIFVLLLPSSPLLSVFISFSVFLNQLGKKSVSFMLLFKILLLRSQATDNSIPVKIDSFDIISFIDTLSV